MIKNKSVEKTVIHPFNLNIPFASSSIIIDLYNTLFHESCLPIVFYSLSLCCIIKDSSCLQNCFQAITFFHYLALNPMICSSQNWWTFHYLIWFLHVAIWWWWTHKFLASFATLILTNMHHQNQTIMFFFFFFLLAF